MMPILTGEKAGFNHLVKKLDPQYSLPNRKYFSKTALPNMYEEYRKKVPAILLSVHYYASSFDLWPSSTADPCLSLTVHYSNSEWEMCISNLKTSYIPEDHSGKNIATGLKDFLQSGTSTKESRCA